MLSVRAAGEQPTHNSLVAVKLCLHDERPWMADNLGFMQSWSLILPCSSVASGRPHGQPIQRGQAPAFAKASARQAVTALPAAAVGCGFGEHSAGRQLVHKRELSAIRAWVTPGIPFAGKGEPCVGWVKCHIRHSGPGHDTIRGTLNDPTVTCRPGHVTCCLGTLHRLLRGTSRPPPSETLGRSKGASATPLLLSLPAHHPLLARSASR
jgi:hypothetical protein